MSLSLSLLGVFQASLNEQPVTEFYSSKVRALLAYLAVETGRQHPRPVLAALLWPGWDDRAALGNLRFSLSKLRQAIHDQDSLPPFLLIDRDTIQLNPSADVSVDVHVFEAELRASRWESADAEGQPEATVQSALEHLRTAMDLVRGSFLEGFTVGDSAAFEEWALIKREQLEREARAALHGLTALYQRLGDYASAEPSVRRLLEMDPWDELANRRLMAVLLQAGQRNAALRHYAAYHEELARELGCEPEEETQVFYAQIRDGTIRLQPSPAIPAPLSGRADGSEAASAPFRFVAREEEMARLDALLHRALFGQPAPGRSAMPGGGVALIAGEAGSGKTALLDEWARRAGRAHGDLIVLRGSCNAYAGTGDPYLPFREILQALAGDVEGKRAGWMLSPEQVRRVWEALPAVGAALVEHGPDLIDSFVPGEALLRRAEGLAGGWQAPLQTIIRRAREGAAPASGNGPAAPAPQPDLFAQVTQVLHTVYLGRPLLLAVDDLQWAGSGTAALLFHLGRRLAGSRILLACAYRPEALEDPLDPEGLGRLLGSVLQELRREWGDVLIDLDRADGRAFVEAYVDSEPNRLGAAFRQALYDHTGGNPLFTVELLRSFNRQGALVQDEAGHWIEAHGLDWDHCPPRVEAVIAGHLAGLPDEDRALLQAASVQGERFAAEVAARVLGWSEEAAVRCLSSPLMTRHRLVEAASLDRLVSTGQRLSHYRFRHWVVQRSAYLSLDVVARARLHEATGRALEAIYAPPAGQAAGEQFQMLAPELARHYEAAGIPLDAARYRLEAGQWAARLVAYDEAIAHLERGLALLEGAPASGERLRLELALCLALVSPAMLQMGWRAPVYRQALERLFDLTQHPDLQDDPQRCTALSVLAVMTTWSADPERGRRVGEQLLGLGQGGDRHSLMLAHWVLGQNHWLHGQLITAREHLGQALALHDPGAGHPLSPMLGANPGVSGRVLLGSALWLLGYADQGRASLRQALAQAQAIEQPASVAFVHLMAGVIHFILGRDVAAAQSHAAALRLLGGTGLEYGAWAELLAAQGGQAGAAGLEQSLARAAEAVSASQAAGAGVGHAAQLLVQVQMRARAGQAEMALGAVGRAMAWIERTGVRVLEAEMWRMRGELLLLAGRALTPSPSPGGRGEVGEAEACFHRALDIARGQQARWLELRAAANLARLWHSLRSQGRREEARELLAGVYDWFTEGFDTVDLVEAKALLEELE
jgi:DNA-binding SARP family transcriptional activator